MPIPTTLGLADSIVLRDSVLRAAGSEGSWVMGLMLGDSSMELMSKFALAACPLSRLPVMGWLYGRIGILSEDRWPGGWEDSRGRVCGDIEPAEGDTPPFDELGDD